MPQLDQFTYLTQFFWLCFLLFTFYIALFNAGDGLLGISRILKLRNHLLSSHRTNNHLRRKDEPNGLILSNGVSTGIAYLYASLVEVSSWCKAVNVSGGKGVTKIDKKTFLSCIGEISGSRGLERNIVYLISQSDYSYSYKPVWVRTCRKEMMLIQVIHSQKSIGF